MNRKLLASVVLGAAMAGTAALTAFATPRHKVAAVQDKFSLEQMIPERFGSWRVDRTIVPLTPDETQKELIETLYDQTLARTYVNDAGQRVMLSIAYGGDQSKQLQLHLPEVCYVAQGFDMVDANKGELATHYGTVPIKRLVARQNARNEPITYWVTVGDKAVSSGLGQKYQRFVYGLTGKIPDGMLVRVSTIEADAAHAYQVQDRFVVQMLDALAPRDRGRLIGAATKQG
ncbi:exosortase-associated protein EpsI, B-type [uncultured Massilia sp.]|uniref:exosortase-associated protein EpsI, B-type n=1 Tax=uncultured Massilia sp. TaxID=169973 RepID=UPI0025E5B297|nr:exosortase-associated protein EpsI, B-type [uncultured Massilia sp.]